MKKWYYDADDQQIKEGDFETIATSKITGRTQKVDFVYDKYDGMVKAIISGAQYTEEQLANNPYYEVK